MSRVGFGLYYTALLFVQQAPTSDCAMRRGGERTGENPISWLRRKEESCKEASIRLLFSIRVCSSTTHP